MKQNINSRIIKSNRLDRAWSQEHLAHISGISIRTVQRVELTGTASLETIKALSSALEVSIDDLKADSNQPNLTIKYTKDYLRSEQFQQSVHLVYPPVHCFLVILYSQIKCYWIWRSQ